MCMNYSAGFPSVSVLKCALHEPCADPARGRDKRCHNDIVLNKYPFHYFQYLRKEKRHTEKHRFRRLPGT